MVDYADIKADVSKMLGLKFGSYDASVKNLGKIYREESKPPIKQNLSTHLKSIFYKDDKRVAIATLNADDGVVVRSIEDTTTGRTYSTGWQEESCTSTKFKYINYKGFAIEDTNNNGIVDTEDKVYIYRNDGGKTIADILNGNIQTNDETTEE